MSINESSFLGKNSLYIILLLALALTVSIWKGCQDERESPPKSLPTLVDIQNPVAVAIIDANRLLDASMLQVTVELIDPDSMVVTSSGHSFESIEITEGVFSLGLKSQARPSVETPYRFVLKVTADGYSTNYKSVRITSSEGQYVPIFMASIANPPVGAASFEGNLALNAGRLNNAATLTPIVANGISTTGLQVDIPAGFQPIYCEGRDLNNPLPTRLDYRISYGAPQHVATGRTFPGGSIITDAVDEDGTIAATPSSPITFTTAGWMNLEMDADGAEVNGFTKPLAVRMPISETQINPNTGQPFQPGNQIGVWSLNSRGAWREEHTTTVQTDAEGLFAMMEVTHLSTWNLDAKNSPCATSTQDLTISYTNNSAGALTCYSELINRNDGQAFPVTGAGDVTNHTLSFSAGSDNFTIGRAPDGVDVEFVAYDNAAAPGGVIASTGAFTIDCSSQPSPSFTIDATTAMNEVNLNIQVITGTTTHQVCNNAIWYKECVTCDGTDASGSGNCLSQASNSFQFGGFLNSGTTGTVTLRKLSSFNNVHCLRLWYSQISGSTLGSEPIDFPVDFSNTTTAETINGIITTAAGTFGVTIEHTYDVGTDIHTLQITNGVSTFASCSSS